MVDHQNDATCNLNLKHPIRQVIFDGEGEKKREREREREKETCFYCFSWFLLYVHCFSVSFFTVFPQNLEIPCIKSSQHNAEETSAQAMIAPGGPDRSESNASPICHCAKVDSKIWSLLNKALVVPN